MLRIFTAIISIGVALGFALVIYLVATNNRVVPTSPTSESSTSSKTDEVRVKELEERLKKLETSKNTDEPKTSDERGAVRKGWDDFTSLFDGPCSVRSRVVPLESKWLPINKSGDQECLVVYEYRPGTRVEARNGVEPFPLVNGLIKGRSIYEVRWVNGEYYFKYSLCSMSLNGKRLNLDCSEKS